MTPKIWCAGAVFAAALAPAAAQAQPRPVCPDGARPIETYFPLGSSEVSKDAYPLLEIILRKAGPNGRISVDGRVDASEPVALAMARAQSIGQLFKGAGVAEARLAITSSGASLPAVDKPGPLAENRRALMCVSPG
jgi:outer membrane protein OmpA-like peptidoglycan-associated protein